MSRRHFADALDVFDEYLPAATRVYHDAIRGGMTRPVVCIADVMTAAGRDQAAQFVGWPTVGGRIEAMQGGFRAGGVSPVLWAVERYDVLHYWGDVPIVYAVMGDADRPELMFSLVWARGDFKLCSAGIRDEQQC